MFFQILPHIRVCFYVHRYKSEVGLSASEYFLGRMEIGIKILAVLSKILNMETTSHN